jgi:hypothetical protein
MMKSKIFAFLPTQFIYKFTFPMFFSQQTAVSVNNINQLVFVMEPV